MGHGCFRWSIGIGLLVLAAILAIAIPRGPRVRRTRGRTSTPICPATGAPSACWSAIFVATILLVDPLGWAITGALMFAGCATVLGSKHYVRNIVIGAVLSIASFYAFYSGLGIPLPAGILDGIL